MREVARYSLVEVDPETHRARLARDGKALELAVTGVILEAQFELPDGSALIWLTQDCPYEEGLHVYLIRPDGGLEDALEAGAAYTPGILKIQATGETWVQLGFFGNGVVYRLEVEPRARARWLLPLGWRYKRRLAKHRLVVRPERREAS
jgi:hypothetical protein